MNTRSKRTFLTTLLLGPALLAIALVLSTDKPASGAGGGGSSFAENITGVWLSNPDSPGPFFQVGFQILTHFHADGTMFWSHNREYGGVGFGKDGAVYCIWEQTGPLELTTRELGFLYTVGGRHEQTGRVSTVFTFSEDFQTYTADAFEEVFEAGDMPTDPDVEPLFAFNFSYSGERLNMPE